MIKIESYYQRNKRKILNQKKLYYKKNKKEIDKKRAIYVKIHKDEVNCKQNLFYKKHRKKFLRKAKLFYHNTVRLLYYGEGKDMTREKIIKTRATKLWHRAKIRKKPKFQITKLWIKRKLLTGHCEVTGIGFDYTKPKPHYNANPFAPSLDRIDCSKGYTYKNTQVVIWAYNVAKSFLDPADFKKLYRGLRIKFNE